MPMTPHDGDDDPTAVIRRQVSVEPLSSPPCVVSIVEGPGSGVAHRIDDLASRRVLIGQSPVCDVTLTDRAVSRRHAALELEAAALRLTDLGSINGTWVNGLQIRDVMLRGGEHVSLGSTVLRIDVGPTAHQIPASSETRFGRVLGASPEMRRLYPMFEKLAASEVPVLIEGETGTGKEVLAEALHEEGKRTGPFVVFDCTAVAPTLLEAELFGHERGAFTGADRARMGLFEEANGGTLFIDEIGDLDLTLQAKLLRALERREIRRVGGNGMLRVDVRIIAATRRDLDREVQARRFRDDLFYRLAVARVDLPPLRKRKGDITLLTRCFWSLLEAEDTSIPPDLLQRFEAYDWPGNVRELYNAVAGQLALGQVSLPGRGVPAETPPATGDFMDRIIAEDTPLPRARHEVTLELERRYVKHMLALHNGNVGRAAAASGIGRRYFQMLRAKL